MGEQKTNEAIAKEILQLWPTFDDVQKSYVIQEMIREVGEDKFKKAAMILVGNNETEYKRLKEMKFNVSIQFPLPEPSPEFETAPSVNPGTLTLTLPLSPEKKA